MRGFRKDEGIAPYLLQHLIFTIRKNEVLWKVQLTAASCELRMRGTLRFGVPSTAPHLYGKNIGRL